MDFAWMNIDVSWYNEAQQRGTEPFANQRRSQLVICETGRKRKRPVSRWIKLRRRDNIPCEGCLASAFCRKFCDFCHSSLKPLYHPLSAGRISVFARKPLKLTRSPSLRIIIAELILREWIVMCRDIMRFRKRKGSSRERSWIPLKIKLNPPA